MAKKVKQEKSSALVKYSAADVVAAQPIIVKALEQIAVVLSQAELGAPTLAAAMLVLRETKNTIEKGLEPVAKQRMIEMLKKDGQQTTDKGSMEAQVGGWKLSMSPTRTGIDPKKLEARLRSKQVDPAKYMRQTISYAIDEDKLNSLIDKRVMSNDELVDCRYEESWTVRTPTKT